MPLWHTYLFWISYLNSCSKYILTSSVPLKAGKKPPTWKVTSLYQEVRRRPHHQRLCEQPSYLLTQWPGQLKLLCLINSSQVTFSLFKRLLLWVSYLGPPPILIKFVLLFLISAFLKGVLRQEPRRAQEKLLSFLYKWNHSLFRCKVNLF